MRYFILFGLLSSVSIFAQVEVLSSTGKKIVVNRDANATQKGLLRLTNELSGVADSVVVTNQAVLGKVLTGFATNNAAVAATDNIVTAFGKMQGQLNTISLNGAAGVWSVPPNQTIDFYLSLPSFNTKYSFFLSSSITNGLIVYNADIITTNSNTHMRLLRKLRWRFNGNLLNLVMDPVELQPNRVLLNVVNNSSSGYFSAYNDSVGFRIQNSSTTETALVYWKYTY